MRVCDDFSVNPSMNQNLSAGGLTTKFSDPVWTAKAERRAHVTLAGLQTLWFNTGTLCNITCEGCYIESSPRNGRLAYLSREEVRALLDEAGRNHPELREVGFTGGEPFMNPDIIAILGDALEAGHRVLVLTNAMKPMQLHSRELLKLRTELKDRGQLTIRVSLDHYGKPGHEKIRGEKTWEPALKGVHWLTRHDFDLAIATRSLDRESDASIRTGFAHLFELEGIPIDVTDSHRLVLFPEMDDTIDVPEITERCWDILGKSPTTVMCSSARMVVKRKGAAAPVITACTLLPYDSRFEMGDTLQGAVGPVSLNHPHCAKFCVLGGASCSG
jgi:pyruvate-formate lyase-activating enzyme